MKRERHSGTHSSEYLAWQGMRTRCYNENTPNFSDYGGRGIKVCERWRVSFSTFLSDIGPKPSPQHSLDRFPNNDGDYEPGNVRWATRKEQARNTRTNKRITIGGVTKTLVEWAETSGIDQNTLWYRLEAGVSPFDATTTPIGKSKTVEIKRGHRFGRLSVVKEMPEEVRTGRSRLNRRRIFRCRCDCGKTINVPMLNLRRKGSGTKSCGCLQRDTARNRTKRIFDA